jgi:hypothetical protein
MDTLPQDSPAPVDPMVYRDLLIFEENLRNQYVYLHNRRRKYFGILHPCPPIADTNSIRLWPPNMANILHLWHHYCSKPSIFQISSLLIGTVLLYPSIPSFIPSRRAFHPYPLLCLFSPPQNIDIPQKVSLSHK